MLGFSLCSPNFYIPALIVVCVIIVVVVFFMMQMAGSRLSCGCGGPRSYPRLVPVYKTEEEEPKVGYYSDLASARSGTS